MDNLRKELVILRELGIKVNYAELARKYNCDYRIVKKYNEGYDGKAKNEYRKYQVKIISPVEKEYLETLKEISNKIEDKVKGE